MSELYNPNRNAPRNDAPGRTKLTGFKDLDRHIPAPRKQPQAQPAPLEFKGEVNKWYETKRNGHVTRIYLLEIKKDKAIFKDDPSDKHTQSMPLAKFIKFYG